MPVLSKIGSESLVKQEGSQASVGYLPDGRYMVAWTKFDMRQVGVDPATVDPASVGARFYNANGTPMGPELAISPADTFSQIKPQVTVLSSGRFLLTWVDPSATPNAPLLVRTEWVRAQIYDATGLASGPGFMVSNTPVGWDIGLQVVALSGDRFVAVWSANRDFLPLQPNHDIRARIFNSDGSPASPELVVNSETADQQTRHSVSVLEDGRFVVTWIHEQFLGAGQGFAFSLRAQLFAADGTRVGGNFVVEGDSIVSSDVVSLEGGGFLVYWETQPPFGESALPIRAQKFDANGNKVGGAFDLPQSIDLNQLASIQLVTLDNGRMAIVSTEKGNSQQNVWIKVLEADGRPAEVSRFNAPVISDHYILGGAPTVSAMPDGRFSLTWRGGTDGSELKMLVFSAAIQSWTLTGTAGNDRLEGDQLNDTLSGQAGDDEFSGLGGMDTLDGGAGLDTASYAEKTANVVVVLSGANPVNVTVGGVVEDSIRNIENLVGGLGADFLTGDSQNNVFTAGAGNDVVVMLGGADTAYGEGGSDYLYMGEGGDIAIGGAGIDVLLLEGGNDTGYGGDDQDYLFGGAGDDTLLGEGGVDVLLGDAGKDTLLGGAGGDYVYAGADNDIAYGGDGNDIFVMDTGDDSAFGEAGQDYFYMGGGNDSANGGAGVDVFLGGAGNDVFEGGAGVDYAWGEAGNDAFVVRAASGVMVVQDFTAGGVEDQVRLAADTGITSFAQARAASTYYAGMNTTILTIDGDTSVWLVGVNGAQLTTADFAFV